MEKHTPYTDSYFIRTRKIVQEKGDAKVTYAIFMRRPVTYAPKLALNWLQKVISDRNETIEIRENFREGSWVGAGEPMLYVTGKMSCIVDLETIFLQMLGPPCVAAYNAYNMCIEMKQTKFIAKKKNNTNSKVKLALNLGSL